MPLAILVADDVTINLDIIELILVDLGHSVTRVKSGEEAIIVWQQGDGVFDLIFMDIEMPILGGLKSARIIRKMEASQGRNRTPIIAMTAYAIDDARDQYRESGVDDCIEKPFNKANIRSVIKTLTETFPPNTSIHAHHSASVGQSPVSGEVNTREIFNRPELVVRCGVQDEQITEYVAMFIEDVDDHLPALEMAIDTGDLGAAIRRIHSIKGVAGNICADRMYAVSSLLHASAKEGDSNILKDQILFLRSEYELFKRATSLR